MLPVVWVEPEQVLAEQQEQRRPRRRRKMDQIPAIKRIKENDGMATADKGLGSQLERRQMEEEKGKKE